MAEYVVVDKEQFEADLTVVADAIREKGGTTEQLEFPQGMKQAVEAIQSGDSFYDVFWDAYQQNGERTDYQSAFYGAGWTGDVFKPKYDIRPTSVQNMFTSSRMTGDLESKLNELGIVLDFSQTTAGTYVFRNSLFEVLPIINASNIASMYFWFTDCSNLKTIRKIIVSSKCTSLGAFANCYKLENVIFDGEIVANISFVHSSLLSDESVQSIIDCLADLTGATAQTVTFHADVKAKLTEAQIATITGKNWTLA